MKMIELCQYNIRKSLVDRGKYIDFTIKGETAQEILDSISNTNQKKASQNASNRVTDTNLNKQEVKQNGRTKD